MKAKLEFEVLTLFPEMFAAMEYSIMGRALEEGRVGLKAHNLRDWAVNRYGQVDDTPYGGGAGMVLRVDCLHRAWKEIKGRRKMRTILMSARGKSYKQKDAERLSNEKRLLLICGHYEGVDERFVEMCVDEEIAIGEYVLTGGELPAMVVMDSVARLVKGVVGKEESVKEESFSEVLAGKREYPHYTKPAVYEGREVPEVLRSGNHKEIEKWRKKNLR